MITISTENLTTDQLCELWRQFHSDYVNAAHSDRPQWLVDLNKRIAEQLETEIGDI